MFNFNDYRNRTHDYSYKWLEMNAIKPSVSKDALPFTVADNDFMTPTIFQEKMAEVARSGIFGYTKPSDAYYDALTLWLQRRHDWTIEREWVVQSPGVVTGIKNAVKAYTEESDGVVILSPVYYPFKKSIEGLNRVCLESTLVNESGVFVINYNEFETLCALPETKIFLLCNPHNPVGRVFTKRELERISEICERHQILIFSDEIHADIIMEGYSHTVFDTISSYAHEHTITFQAASKSFNIAGLQNSHVIIANETLRNQFIDFVSNDGTGTNTNVLGVEATRIAYTYCEPWFDEFLYLIQSNYRMITEFVDHHNLPITVSHLEGTYLLWLDFNPTGWSEEKIVDKLRENDLFMSVGSVFGTAGTGFMRMNIGCPNHCISWALDQLLKAL